MGGSGEGRGERRGAWRGKRSIASARKQDSTRPGEERKGLAGGPFPLLHPAGGRRARRPASGWFALPGPRRLYVCERSQKKRAAPVLGFSIPVLGMKLKRG